MLCWCISQFLSLRYPYFTNYSLNLTLVKSLYLLVKNLILAGGLPPIKIYKNRMVPWSLVLGPAIHIHFQTAEPLFQDPAGTHIILLVRTGFMAWLLNHALPTKMELVAG